MTTPIVLPREVVERLREHTKWLSTIDGTGMRRDAHNDLPVLDAALAEPSGVEPGAHDGQLCVCHPPNGGWGYVTVERREGLIAVTDRHGSGDVCSEVEIASKLSRAVALALLSLTEEA